MGGGHWDDLKYLLIFGGFVVILIFAFLVIALMRAIKPSNNQTITDNIQAVTPKPEFSKMLYFLAIFQVLLIAYGYVPFLRVFLYSLESIWLFSPLVVGISTVLSFISMRRGANLVAPRYALISAFILLISWAMNTGFF